MVAGSPDFYARARANAERADVVVVNHALLLNLFLRDRNAPAEDQEEAFTRRVVCEEELRRYGVRIRLEAAALSAAGGPAVRTAAESLQSQLRGLALALGQV